MATGEGMERFLQGFETLGRIGQNAQGGLDRLALSQPELLLRGEIVKRTRALGLPDYADGGNNLWIYKEGSDPALPPLIMGSHVDAVPDGGRFDGFLGVMAGLHLLEEVCRRKIPHRRGIWLVVFEAEESSRFNQGTVGSKLAAGKLQAEKLGGFCDGEGISMRQELERIGVFKTDFSAETRRLRECFGFFELHIEQGPVLEREGLDIGVVNCIAAPIRLKLTLQGSADHSGACPMHMRRDALAAAAKVVLAVEEAGRAESVHQTVATVGKCVVPGQALNVVPGRVELYLDLRGIDGESVERVYRTVLARAGEICARRDIRWEEELLSREKPVALDAGMTACIGRVCERLGLSYKVMPSGAGHDTMNVAAVAPAGMAFIPCLGGVSHNRAEAVDTANLEKGMRLVWGLFEECCR